MFKIKTLTASLMLLGALALTGCKDPLAPEPKPSPSTVCFVKDELVTVCQQRPPVECLQEGVELATECNEKDVLPECLEEDDWRDGAAGPECYWQDSHTGWLWYNDGNGQG